MIKVRGQPVQHRKADKKNQTTVRLHRNRMIAGILSPVFRAPFQERERLLTAVSQTTYCRILSSPCHTTYAAQHSLHTLDPYHFVTIFNSVPGVNNQVLFLRCTDFVSLVLSLTTKDSANFLVHFLES